MALSRLVVIWYLNSFWRDFCWKLMNTNISAIVLMICAAMNVADSGSLTALLDFSLARRGDYPD